MDLKALQATLGQLARIQNETPIIFSDGACSGNPGPGAWGAILVFRGRVKEMGLRESGTTNNRMEMMGALASLRSARLLQPAVARPKVHVLTDSTYLIKGASEWLGSWQRRSWKTADGSAVKNQDLWMEFSETLKEVAVQWHYVPGHSGVAGNERCDEIAVGLTQQRPVDLYDGDLASYGPQLFELDQDQTYPVYLAAVGREVMAFAKWPACEAAVKGRPGARFKKVKSKAEWQECLRSWGFPSDVKVKSQ